MSKSKLAIEQGLLIGAPAANPRPAKSGYARIVTSDTRK